LSDDDRAGAEDQDLGDVSAFGHSVLSSRFSVLSANADHAIFAPLL
jgi:hypothetical protein